MPALRCGRALAHGTSWCALWPCALHRVPVPFLLWCCSHWRMASRGACCVFAGGAALSWAQCALMHSALRLCSPGLTGRLVWGGARVVRGSGAGSKMRFVLGAWHLWCALWPCALRRVPVPGLRVRWDFGHFGRDGQSGCTCARPTELIRRWRVCSGQLCSLYQLVQSLQSRIRRTKLLKNTFGVF